MRGTAIKRQEGGKKGAEGLQSGGRGAGRERKGCGVVGRGRREREGCKVMGEGAGKGAEGVERYGN